MNGLNLKEMKAPDMVDVLHFFFEDDMNSASAEHAEAKDRSREIIYRELYDTRYAYSNTQGRSDFSYSAGEQGVTKDFNLDHEEEAIKVFDPMKKPPKSFFPPTKLNAASPKPFGEVLDEPMSR